MLHRSSLEAFRIGCPEDRDGHRDRPLTCPEKLCGTDRKGIGQDHTGSRIAGARMAMHHPVQFEGLRSHLALGYVAHTDHVTARAASRRRLLTPTPHLFREPITQRLIMHLFSTSSYVYLPPPLPSASSYMQRLRTRLECLSPPCQLR
jgi:hypothetical protein